MRGKIGQKKPEFHKKTSILIPNKRFEDSKETKRQKKLVFQKKRGITIYVKANITVKDNTCSSAYVSGIWIPGAFALITTGKG